MGTQPDSPGTDNLCVLNDVRLFDLAAQKWIPDTSSSSSTEPSSSSASAEHPTSSSPPSSSFQSQTPTPLLIPRGRYAHLSSVTASRLFIIGGQDINNNWVDDICVYDLKERRWVQRKTYSRPSGTYRSVAVSAQWGIVRPQSTATTKKVQEEVAAVQYEEGTEQEKPALVHLPYSVEPCEEDPNDIYVYSNYNVGLPFFHFTSITNLLYSSPTSNANSKSSPSCPHRPLVPPPISTTTIPIIPTPAIRPRLNPRLRPASVRGLHPNNHQLSKHIDRLAKRHTITNFNALICKL